jgi:hypothetical protein
MKREPFRECPSFFHCGVNQCPLDSTMQRREVLPADHDQRCKATRATREAIAARYPGLLPSGGLTWREVARDKRQAAKQAWYAALSPEEQAWLKATLAEGRKVLESHRAKAD